MIATENLKGKSGVYCAIHPLNRGNAVEDQHFWSWQVSFRRNTSEHQRRFEACFCSKRFNA